MPQPGPIANEVLSALTERPLPIKVDDPLPVVPAGPVPTYPGVAPPGSPTATPQPVYMKTDPNSWWGTSPIATRLFQGGAIGVVVIAFWLMLRDKLSSDSDGRQASAKIQADTQVALIDAFKSAQADRTEEARHLNTAILKTQTDIQLEIRSLADLVKAQTRVLEKLEAKIDGRKEENATPPGTASRPGGSE
jgi:hypothetical protein